MISWLPDPGRKCREMFAKKDYPPGGDYCRKTEISSNTRRHLHLTVYPSLYIHPSTPITRDFWRCKETKVKKGGLFGFLLQRCNSIFFISSVCCLLFIVYCQIQSDLGKGMRRTCQIRGAIG